MSDLADKKCIPCEGNISAFKFDEIHKYLKKVDGWDVKEEQSNSFYLIKEFEFNNFIESQNFINKVGEISEPFFLPKGILLFKVKDKRVVDNSINLEEAKKRIVKAEKMKMLNMFSLSHFDKLRRSITIVYY